MEEAVLIKQQIRVEVWEKAVRPTTSWVNPGGMPDEYMGREYYHCTNARWKVLGDMGV